MRILELYNDYRVNFVTEGHKHCREGWVNTACPFCTGNAGYHLGYNTYDNYFHCWRCGGKQASKAISKILSIPESKARNLIRQYGGIAKRNKEAPKVTVNLKPFKYPSGELKLLPPHIKYLENRNYDVDKLVHDWNITGTGPLSFLDDINYSRRILAPIEWDGKTVSFQTRDVTGKHSMKYMACPQAREEVEHQTILYGNPLKWQKRGICVEGITDVWRLGPLSFAVFGIDYTLDQVRQIKKFFDEVIVLFDPDPQAQVQADKIVAQLRFKGVDAHKEFIPTDPGALSQNDANHLIKSLL